MIVAIVDDNPIICGLLQTMIQKIRPDVTVLIFEEGKKFLEYEFERLDIAFVDLCMPRIDGYEIIKHIKENWYSTMIIAITAYESGTLNITQIGADVLIQKPFCIHEVVNLIPRG